FSAAGFFVPREVLDAEPAKQIAAALEFIVHALEDTEAEFAVALDGHNARVRETAHRIALELDALLEVHEIELDLLGTAPEREVRDHDVEQSRFARAGFSRDQGVLARAFANGQILKFCRAA